MPKRSASDRILHTAMEVISDFGVRRFTVDELARRVGLSRVTIYRHFESRQEVLEATMLHELAKFNAGIEAAVAGYEDPERRILEAFVLAVSSLREHAVLQRLLRTEPELILPLLTVKGGPVISSGRELIVRLAVSGTTTDPGAGAPGAAELDVVAELLARLILSLVLTPDPVDEAGADAQLRSYAALLLQALRTFTPAP